MPWEWTEPFAERENQKKADMEAAAVVTRLQHRTAAILTQLSYHLNAGPTAFILTEWNDRQFFALFC